MRLLNRIATMLALVALAAVLAPLMVVPSSAQAPERRFALDIGNSEYTAGRLPTAANDAGLLAETLRGAGFDVTGARDLDQDTLRRAIRDFLDKVSAAGPEAVTFVYLGGYGLQFDGENYLVPVDATIRRDEDIPIEAFRISDFTRPLAGLPGTVKIVVIDAARQHPFTPSGLPLASGLALVDPDPGVLIAFNATPGSIAPVEDGPYGAYGQSLSEMIATGGLGLDDLFERVRLRVNEKTNGVAVPWYASKIARPFLFMQRAPGAPPPPQAVAAADLQTRSISDFQGDQEAFTAAMARDTLSGYEEFLAAYPDSPLAVRVRAMVAVRREAITWRRTLNYNTREAYWSYLRRYPEGAHVADAQRRLARLAAAFDPPPAFVPLAYDVPPPPPDEVVYLSQPVVVFDGPGFYPPPPIPVLFLPPPPPAFVVLLPPPDPIGPFFLPAPVLPFAAIGVGVGVGVGIGVGLFAVAPAFVVPPAPTVVQQINVNNTTIINNNTTINQTTKLPGAVVSQVNSGKLTPQVGGQALTHAALQTTGTGPLGNKGVQPPPQAKQIVPTPNGVAATNTNKPGPTNAALGTPPGNNQQGPRGPANANLGPQGPQGPKGTPGNQGPAGPANANLGPQGPQGPKGTPGNQGLGGPANANLGPQGPQGLKGTPGNQGPGGPANANLGPQGPQGPKGTPGNQGPGGPANANLGPQGPQGQKGTPGNQGPGGPANANLGPQGPQGPKGTPGNQGPGGPANANLGPQGPQGPKGTPGNQGPRGPANANLGPQGPAGGPPSNNTPPPRLPQVVNKPPPTPPPVVNHAPPPPPVVSRPPPPPPVVNRPPPPVAAVRPPPPPVVNRPPPPPPPAAAKKCVPGQVCR
jgi:uncharacterized caspase-like protein